MKQKLRILIIVGVLLIIAIITKIAFADLNEEEVKQSAIELGKEEIPIEGIYSNGVYHQSGQNNTLIDGKYPLTEDEMEILGQRYTLGDASTVEADRNSKEPIDKDSIDTNDALKILEWYCEYSLIEGGNPSKAMMYVGDLNRDGEIGPDDAVTALKYVTAVLIERADNIEEFLEQEKLEKEKLEQAPKVQEIQEQEESEQAETNTNEED